MSSHDNDGYHPDNLKHQPYPAEKVIELCKHARELGIQFKICGMPFGAPYDKPLWDAFWEKEGRTSSAKPIAETPSSVEGVNPNPSGKKSGAGNA